MPVLPSGVKHFLSNRFPLAYHLVVNFGVKGNSEEHWNSWLAETWDNPKWSWPVKVAAIVQVVEPKESIVDIGCGNGSMLRDLRDHGYAKLHGLEQSGYAVKRLSAEGIPMSQGDLLQMPFKNSQFDVALASDVLEHVIRRNRFCRELSRIVRPSGKILIFVPNNCLGPIDTPEHVIIYNASSLRVFLNRHWVVESISIVVERPNGPGDLFAICRNTRPG